MNFTPTKLEGCFLIESHIITDSRGYFMESFNEMTFQLGVGQPVHFVQDNQSFSRQGVLRGLHYQTGSHAQAKLVRVVKGAVLDVCVDIRPDSPTYGAHYKLVLDGASKEMLYIPEGFAHGFHTLEDGTIFAYKCSRYYDRSSERTIRWNDPALAIDWQAPDPVLSAKDLDGLPFSQNPWPRTDV